MTNMTVKGIYSKSISYSTGSIINTENTGVLGEKEIYLYLEKMKSILSNYPKKEEMNKIIKGGMDNDYLYSDIGEWLNKNGNRYSTRDEYGLVEGVIGISLGKDDKGYVSLIVDKCTYTTGSELDISEINMVTSILLRSDKKDMIDI